MFPLKSILHNAIIMKIPLIQIPFENYTEIRLRILMMQFERFVRQICYYILTLTANLEQKLDIKDDQMLPQW